MPQTIFFCHETSVKNFIKSLQVKYDSEGLEISWYDLYPGGEFRRGIAILTDFFA